MHEPKTLVNGAAHFVGTQADNQPIIPSCQAIHGIQESYHSSCGGVGSYGTHCHKIVPCAVASSPS